MKTKLIACIIVASVLSGCTSLGPKVIKHEQRPYNEALVYTWKEQLLLNLVRLKYRDDPYFLEVSSVTSNHTLGLTTGLELKFPEMSTPVSQSLSSGISYTNQPVIVYMPLQGEDYVKKILSPIPLKMIFALAHSGWSIERVLDICVQEINGVYNAVSAAGPTPDYVPEYREFEYLAHNLRILQNANLLVAAEDPCWDPLAHCNIIDPEKDLYFKIIRTRGHEATIAEVLNTLHLDPCGDLYQFTTNMLKADCPNVIKIKPRTFLGVMYYLAQSVQVPQPHIDAGLVNETICENGMPCDWSQIIGEDMQIHHSCAEPCYAAVKVCYRGYWFYIDDRDLSSKSTFMLLSKLFNSQSAPGGPATTAPQLTIPLK